MSKQNLERIKLGYEAFARGDLDYLIAMMDPEIEAHNPPEVPEASVHYGPAAVRRDWEQTWELFDEFTVEPEEFLAAGDDVIVFAQYRGRARGSGADIEAAVAQVFTFRDGKVILFRQFLDRAQALKAAGLPE